MPLRIGRFRPALDAGGAPVPGSYSLQVRWVLPRDEAAPPAAARERSHRRGWFERMVAAHHPIGGLTVLVGFLGARVRRRWNGGRRDGADGWPDGDRFVPPRRRWWRDVRGGRIAAAVVSPVLLAALMAWLGW